jgi:hypothetical protein
MGVKGSEVERQRKFSADFFQVDEQEVMFD